MRAFLSTALSFVLVLPAAAQQTPLGPPTIQAITIGGSTITGVGSAHGQVAAADDTRIVGALQAANLVSSLAAQSVAVRMALGLAPVAVSGSASDITSGVLGAAQLPVGTGAGQVAAGNDSRITGALQSGNALSELLAASLQPAAKANLTAILGPVAAGCTVVAAGVTCRDTATRAADVYNIRDYGAVGDGTVHTAGSTLPGVNSLATLAGYTTTSGAKPFAWVTQYPFGVSYKLRVSGTVQPGTGPIPFAKTAAIGVTIPTISDQPTNQSALRISPWGGIAAGTVVNCTGGSVPANDTVAQPYGGSVALNSNTTAATPAKTLCTFQAPTQGLSVLAQPVTFQLAAFAPAGSKTLQVAGNIPAGAIAAGASVGGIGTAGGTKVVSYDGATLTIDTGTTADIQAANNVTINVQAANVAGQPYLSVQYLPGIEKIAAGTPIGGPALPAAMTIGSVKVTAYNQFGVPTYALVTMTGGTSAAATTYAPVTISAAFELFAQNTTGLYRKTPMSGATLQAGTEAEFANQATGGVRLSKPTVGLPAGNAPIAFVPSELASLAQGMRMIGAGQPTGQTVASVDTVAGTVTPTLATTAPLYPDMPNYAPNTAAPNQAEGTSVIFWRPFTDAEATALSMDWLGAQAAERAAETAGGGTMYAPGGHYRPDNTIVFPVASQYLASPSVVSLVGDGQWQTFFEPARDYGSNGYVLSCGDPNQDSTNLLGFQQNLFCRGDWANLRVRMPGFYSQPGLRPTVGGKPVRMSGVLRGPRRHLDQDVTIEGFDNGDEFQGDHTHRGTVTLSGNFCGTRIREALPGLYGDLDDDQIEGYGNGWAGVCIARNSYMSGSLKKENAAGAPYGIYMEPGLPAYQSAINTTSVDQPNWEWDTCGTVIDGNIAPNFLGTGAARGIEGMNVASPFILSGNDVQVTLMPGGCHAPYPGAPTTLPGSIAPAAHFDVFSLLGLRITGVGQYSLQPITGGQSLFRAWYTRNFGTNKDGGVFLSGGFLPSLLDAYAAAGQQIFTGPGDASSLTAFGGGANHAVRWEVPGLMRGTVYPLLDAGATTLAKGQVFEFKAGSGILGVQRAGTAAAGTAQIAGVSPSATNVSMVNKFIPLATAGSEIPVAVSAAQPLGTLLGADTSNPGKAAVTTATGPTSFLGTVSDANGGSASQVFVQTPGF